MIKNEKFNIHAVNSDTFCVVTHNQPLANRLNRALNYYPGQIIRKGEEPLFLISQQMKPVFLSELNKSIPKATLDDLIENLLENYTKNSI